MAGFMAAESVAPSIASTLMVSSPWLPLLLGFGIMFAGGALLLFVPETIHRKPVHGNLRESPWGGCRSSSAKPTTLSKLKSDFQQIAKSLASIASVPLVLLLITFLLQL